MPVQKLREYLDSHHIKYVTITHSPAYTAQEIAASAHIPGQELAKTVMLKVDGQLAMAVLPASCHVDLELLRSASGAARVALATEGDFEGWFPECELGAMPPFGNLYAMEVFVAEDLADNEAIVFNAGSHTELIRMRYADFENLVNPVVVRFAAHV